MAQRKQGAARAHQHARAPAVGVMYRQGLGISDLKERFVEDASQMTAAQMEVAYGRDHKRGTGLMEGSRDRQITSYHLRSPYYIDQYGIEYTPRDTPTTDSLFARISPREAAKLRRKLEAGDNIDDQSEIGVWCFPPPGTVLQLRIHPRYHGALIREYGRDRAKLMLQEVNASAIVEDLVNPKTASVEILLRQTLQIDEFLIKKRQDVGTVKAVDKGVAAMMALED